MYFLIISTLVVYLNVALFFSAIYYGSAAFKRGGQNDLARRINEGQFVNYYYKASKYKSKWSATKKIVK